MYVSVYIYIYIYMYIYIYRYICMYVCIIGPGNYLTDKGRKRDRVHMDLGFAFTGVERGNLGFQSSLFIGEFKT